MTAETYWSVLKNVYVFGNKLYIIYAVQQDTRSFLMMQFYSSRMLAGHVSDLTGPKHVQLTYVTNKTQSLKNFVYLVGRHIYYKMIHGP